MGLSMGYDMDYAMGYAMGYTMGYAWKGVVSNISRVIPARSVYLVCPMLWVPIYMEGVLFRRRSSGCGGVAEEGN